MKPTNQFEQLAELEKSLEVLLPPIKPSQIFVSDLKEKLATAPRTTLEDHPLTYVYLIFAFGLFIGVFIFWLIRRVVRQNKNRNRIEMETM